MTFVNLSALAQGVDLNTAARNLAQHVDPTIVGAAVAQVRGKMGFTGQLTDPAAWFLVAIIQKGVRQEPAPVELASVVASAKPKSAKKSKQKSEDKQPLLQNRVSTVDQLKAKPGKKSIFCCFCCNVVE